MQRKLTYFFVALDMNILAFFWALFFNRVIGKVLHI